MITRGALRRPPIFRKLIEAENRSAGSPPSCAPD